MTCPLDAISAISPRRCRLCALIGSLGQPNGGARQRPYEAFQCFTSHPRNRLSVLVDAVSLGFAIELSSRNDSLLHFCSQEPPCANLRYVRGLQSGSPYFFLQTPRV